MAGIAVTAADAAQQEPVQSPLGDPPCTALEYSRRGWAVLPLHSANGGRCSCSAGDQCDTPAKHPRTPHGVKDASTDEATIRDWWRRWPEANLGIATGAASGFDVLDVDEGGEETLQQLENKHGPLPATAESLTGGGGRHLLFKYCGSSLGNRVKALPGLDVRSDGGLIVAPPSIHVSGRPYCWNLDRHPEDYPIGEMPPWLREKLAPTREAKPLAQSAGEPIPEGRRNATLTSLAGSMRRRGMTQPEIAAALHAANEARCRPSLGREEVDRIAASVSRYEPAVDAPSVEATVDDEAHETELGLARRLVLRHGAVLRFVFPWSSWLVWDDTHWAPDRTGQTWVLMKDLVDDLYREASGIADTTARENGIRFALRCEKESCMRAALSLAKSDVAVAPEELNRDTGLLNTPTGTVDLRTGDCRAHNRDDLITKLCPTPYEPNIERPTFERFLLRIMEGNLGLISYLQRIFGYALTGTANEHVVFFLIGTGANGKSTLTSAVGNALGRDYAVQVAPDLLFSDRKDAHPTGLADLYGKRVAVTHELDAGTRLAEGRVKQLTGGDRIKARRMREDYWEFDPTHTLFLCANTKPVIRGSDDGIWRRIRLVPFRVRIPAEEQDRDLGEKLQREAPGILSWLVQGARTWAEAGLEDPEGVLAATASYRSDSDILGEFLGDRCHLAPDLWVKAKDLYEAYCSWHEESLGGDPMKQQTFGRRLSDRGFERKKKGTYQWLGLDLQ